MSERGRHVYREKSRSNCQRFLTDNALEKAMLLIMAAADVTADGN